MAANLIPESIREVLEYRPSTGDLIWLVSRGKAKAGDVAGCLDNEGYRLITYRRIAYKAHRIAYFLMTGEQPPEIIDHRNNTTDDNKWSNLRPSDAVRNGLNQRRQKHGLCGVSLKEGRYWYACIQVKGEMIHLYGGKDFFEACCARKSAENRHHRPLLEDEYPGKSSL